MIIDIIVLVLMVLALFKGLRNGLVMAVFSFLAFIIGMAAAVKLSAFVASYLEANTNIGQRWLPFLAFTIVFIAVAILIRLGARAIEGLLSVVMLGWLNRIGGVLLYAVLYLFLFSLFLFYAVQLHVLKPQSLEASVTYPYISPMGPVMIGWLGAALPFFRNMFHQLEGFFSGIAEAHS